MDRAEELFDRIVRGGADHIKDMLAASETEDLFMDYKRSDDDGSGRALHNTDRANLSKAISGFGNSEGGVIVWGVDCRNDPDRGDIPSGLRPLHNPTKFKSWLDQITTGLTVPPHERVRHVALFLEGESLGFAVSFIPKGDHAPYQTVRDLRYLMRAGSNFTPVPHGVLAGMFGRRPQPNVFANFLAEQNYEFDSKEFYYRFGINIHNRGPGIAQDYYINLHILGLGGAQNSMRVEQDHGPMWSSSEFARQMWNCTMMRDYRLAPDATVTPMVVTLLLRPPFTGAFRFRLSAGANGAVPYRGECTVPAEELERHFQAVTLSGPQDFMEACRVFGDRLLRVNSQQS